MTFLSSQPLSLLIIAGPTAVGKSAVAHALARSMNGEIISCDAMQVYREIQIASDKPSLVMRSEVPYHLVDVVSVQDDFNVAQYRRMALESIKDIQSRGRLPIICGGSGMYLMSVLDGLYETGDPNEEVRSRLTAEAEGDGVVSLYARLKEVDPASAQKIKPADRKRIVRALEVFETTGQRLSEIKQEREGIWNASEMKYFVLDRSRDELYARAEKRIDEMFSAGLVDEVRAVTKLKLAAAASKLIGIPEVMGYLEGRHDLERAKYLMKLNTRHYVKRQLTWFRHDERAKWLQIANNEQAAAISDNIRSML